MDDITQEIKRKRLEEYEAKMVKLKKRMKIAGGVLVFLSLIVWWGLQPLKGKIEYGVCRTYAEMNIQYPDTMQISEVKEFDRATRVYYTHIDAFGQSRKELIECAFRRDVNGNLYAEKIEINRLPEPDDKVEKFNATINTIIAFEPDLIIPRYDDVLKNVKFSEPE
jgi:hypothetical protein